jgi:hypothetical protein
MVASETDSGRTGTLSSMDMDDPWVCAFIHARVDQEAAILAAQWE